MIALMPELPEVEVTRRSFAQRICGAEVLSAQVGKPLRWPLGIDVDELRGRTVGEVVRRGKYLWLPLTPPNGRSGGGLLIHLGMSGSLAFTWQPGEPGPHDHFELGTTRGVLRHKARQDGGDGRGGGVGRDLGVAGHGDAFL